MKRVGQFDPPEKTAFKKPNPISVGISHMKSQENKAKVGSFHKIRGERTISQLCPSSPRLTSRTSLLLFLQ